MGCKIDFTSDFQKYLILLGAARGVGGYDEPKSRNMPISTHTCVSPDRCTPPASTLLSQVLERLHATNQGVTGMLANTRDFFWPDLDLDAAVRKMRLQCRQCNEQALS